MILFTGVRSSDQNAISYEGIVIFLLVIFYELIIDIAKMRIVQREAHLKTRMLFARSSVFNFCSLVLVVSVASSDRADEQTWVI